jgi:predicted RNA-binding protein YlxR (DUF448 family)
MVDTTGTAPGRGAYLHPMWDCAAAAFRHGAFTRGLRTVVSAEEAARLEAEIKSTVGAR